MQLVLTPDGDWIKLSNLPKTFSDYVKTGIKPTFRRWDSEKKAWLVHWRGIPTLVSAARGHFEYIDYSALPESWQMLAAGARVPDAPLVVEKIGSEFTVLFVTEDAPIEVVKASYRALAQLYHPDRGGDAAKMANLNLAYERICKLRGAAGS